MRLPWGRRHRCDSARGCWKHPARRGVRRPRRWLLRFAKLVHALFLRALVHFAAVRALPRRAVVNNRFGSLGCGSRLCSSGGGGHSFSLFVYLGNLGSLGFACSPGNLLPSCFCLCGGNVRQPFLPRVSSLLLDPHLVAVLHHFDIKVGALVRVQVWMLQRSRCSDALRRIQRQHLVQQVQRTLRDAGGVARFRKRFAEVLLDDPGVHLL